jgi:hypothetical protein
MIKSFSFLFSLWLLPTFGGAAEITVPAVGPAPLRAAAQPLGRNFFYVRVHTLPDDLPAAVPESHDSIVLDLRFVSAGKEAAEAFAAWLKFQARPAFPVVVLINAHTSPALLRPLSEARSPAGVVCIGPADPTIKPDIALNVSDEADRAAYEAFEHGVPLAELISPKLDKVRHDEATIAKERASGAGDSFDGETDDDFLPVANAPAAVATAAPAAPSGPVDAVLQRALQLHRALLALKKIR